MTTDQLAFLAKIIDQPDDDLPRLVYVDWLQEHDKNESVCPECNGYGTNSTLGGTMGCHRCSTGYKERGTGIIPGNGFAERAEFIRVQIELAKKPCNAFMYSCQELGFPCCQCPDFGKYDQLRLREGQLIDYWMRENGLKEWKFVWDRGFITEAKCTLTDWRTHCSSIVREHPIQKVVCTDKEPLDDAGVVQDHNGFWNDAQHYFWIRSNDPIDRLIRWELPTEIYDLLEKDGDQPTEQAANDDLSQALIRWARSIPFTPASNPRSEAMIERRSLGFSS